MAVITAVWDFRARFDKTLEHAAAVLRRLADETTLPNCALSSLLGQWFVKAGLKNDAPPNALSVLTKAIIRAALLPNLSKATAAKLWAVYTQLVEFHHGSFMDERRERDAIRLLGAECAKLQVTNRGLGEMAHSSLRRGLTEGTSAEENFMAGYSETLLRLRTHAGQTKR